MAEIEGEETKKVRVGGEEGFLHVTDQSVMFEKGGKVTGSRGATIVMAKPGGDVMIML